MKGLKAWEATRSDRVRDMCVGHVAHHRPLADQQRRFIARDEGGTACLGLGLHELDRAGAVVGVN